MKHNVTLQPSGAQFQTEATELLLDAALRQGVRLPYSCRSGTCGACMASLLEGDINYPKGLPRGLSQQQLEDGKLLCCQAVALSTLVLQANIYDSDHEFDVRRLPTRVSTLRKLAEDVMLLELQLPSSQRLPFLAGQYINILLKDGRKRAFSLANAPHDDGVLQLHIRHVPGGDFTTQVFEQMEEKALLRIEGPLGSFYVREAQARPIIMVAGGTGFAPVKAMIEHLIAAEFSQPVFLYWGARTLAGLYLRELAESWTTRHPFIRFIPVLSDVDAEAGWQGRCGWVHEAVGADFPDLGGVDVYACGPPPMIAAAREYFPLRGLPETQFFTDSFEFAEDTQEKISSSDS